MNVVRKNNWIFVLALTGLLICSLHNATASTESTASINRGDRVGTYQIESGDSSVTIPFEMFGKNIRMKGKINGEECYVLLDNGSLWDPLLFFGSPKVDSLDLEIDGSTLVRESTAATASGIKLEFDGLILTDQDAVILPYDPDLPNPWDGADLQVSSAFFKNFVVEIDFDKEVIRLTEPESYTYRGAGEVLKMSPGIFDSRTVQASIKTHEDKSVSLSFLLDLGGIHDLYIPIGSDKDISLPPDARLETLGIGGFGASTGHVGTVKEFRIGKYSLDNVRAAYVAVAEGQDVYGNTMIGLPLLQRFKVTFDYLNERMILEPSSRFPTEN